MIGFNAAQKMKIPATMGAYMGCILIAPAFLNMVTAGDSYSLFGLNVPMVNYAQSFVPVLLSVAFMGFLYRTLDKMLPSALSSVFTPFVASLVATPVALLFLAPLGDNIANAIGGAIGAFANATGFFGVGFIAAIWEFLVMTGMHGAVGMTFMMDYLNNGYMSGAGLSGICATWACFGVALGAFLRLKNQQDKAAAGGFFVSGLVGGVTEPTLYGLCMKYRRCFIPIVIGGFVGGAYIGITNACAYVVGGAANFLLLLFFTGGSTANLVNGIIGCLLSLVVATVTTYLFGFSKEELQA